MNYVFYFDETFHEEKITIKPNGTINALLEDKNNCYVGVFWDCKQEKLPEVIEPLIDLEKKYKKLSHFQIRKSLNLQHFHRKILNMEFARSLN